MLLSIFNTLSLSLIIVMVLLIMLIREGPDNIVYEVEEFLNKLHDDIVDELNDGNVGAEEGNVGLKDASVVVESDNVGVKGVNVVVESDNVEVKVVNVGEVHDEYNSDDSEDDNYHYDSVVEVSFEDDSDGYDGMDDMEEDELANMIGYESDGKGKGKKVGRR